MGLLTAYPDRVRADATSMIVYQGEPLRAIEWELTGSGSLEPIGYYTDESGRAAAIYTPGEPGDVVTIGVTAGA